MIKFQIAGFRSLKRWKILKEQSSTLKEPQSVHSGNILQQLIYCRHNVVSTLPICMLSIALNNVDISIGDRYASPSVEKLTITQLCYLHIETHIHVSKVCRCTTLIALPLSPDKGPVNIYRGKLDRCISNSLLNKSACPILQKHKKLLSYIKSDIGFV